MRGDVIDIFEIVALLGFDPEKAIRENGEKRTIAHPPFARIGSEGRPAALEGAEF